MMRRRHGGLLLVGTVLVLVLGGVGAGRGQEAKAAPQPLPEPLLRKLNATRYTVAAKWRPHPWPDLGWYSGGDVTVSPRGDVYVSYLGFGIQKYTSEGRFVTQWGSRGSGDGQFESALGMAVDAAGTVYVADHLNERIQKFTPEGKFLAKWRLPGGPMPQPWDVAVSNDGIVYVPRSDQTIIQKFRTDGQFLGEWRGLGLGDMIFRTPARIACGPTGDAYVSEHLKPGGILRFEASGRLLTRWILEGWYKEPDRLVGGINDIAVDAAGHVYVADDLGSCVDKLTSEGQLLATFQGTPRARGGRWVPFAIDVDREGNVCVSAFESVLPTLPSPDPYNDDIRTYVYVFRPIVSDE